MSFGTSTVIFRHFQKTGSPDELGNYTLAPIDNSAPGCRHRPLTFKETAELQFDVATEFWRTTLPLCDYTDVLITIIKATKPNDVVVIDGQDYQIIGGVRPHQDLEGEEFKATIISQKHIA